MKQDDIDKLCQIATANAYKFIRDVREDEPKEPDNIVLKQESVFVLPQQESKPVIHVPHHTPTIIVVKPERKYTQARGNKIQRYSPDGKTLLQTYIGFSEACRDPTLASPCQMQLRTAAAKKYLYKSYRWAELQRSEPDDTVQDIGETVPSYQINYGFIAMLDLNSTRIVTVFPDMTAAAQDRKQKSCAAISSSMKRGRPSGGHMFRMWHDCDQSLQIAYLEQNDLPMATVRHNGRVVIKLHPILKTEVERYSSVAHIIKTIMVSRKSIIDAIEKQELLRGYFWIWGENSNKPSE